MIEFFKMSGSGNDFILIDNRDGLLKGMDLKALAVSVCRRNISVGADGLIVIEKSEKADFRWMFFNSDGSEPDMCGNGSRCAARFAFLKGIAGKEMSFETGAGIIDAKLTGDIVKVRLTEPHDMKLDFSIPVGDRPFEVNSINTGVPHVVAFMSGADDEFVFKCGREIRYHSAFKPAGTNVNFVEHAGRNLLRVRTYERGVEGETLACGTGAVASALISAGKGLVDSPVKILVKSGETLKIYYEKSAGFFTNVYLEGRAMVVFEGRLWEEAYK